MTEEDFVDRLEVIKAADDLVLSVYEFTKKFPKDELFGLTSQMRRSAVSVTANIIEGYSRNNNKEKIQFYYISRGSLSELKYYVRLSMKLKYIEENSYKQLMDKVDKTARLLVGWIKYNSNRQSPIANRQSKGQTLIETVVAIFVLTTGLASGLALAVYSFGASSDVATKIVATGLAREGIETVRGKRDSNWIAGTLTDCAEGEGWCYTTWLDGMTGSLEGIAYRVVFDPQSSVNKLTLDPTPYSGADHYRLYEQSGEGLSHVATALPTNFFRKINIIYEFLGGEYDPTSPLVLVRSSVWWYGKRCDNALTDLTDPSQTICKIITEEYLTNWRNY